MFRVSDKPAPRANRRLAVVVPVIGAGLLLPGFASPTAAALPHGADLAMEKTETIKIGQVFRSNWCWEGPGGGRAFLQIKIDGYWTNVAEGQYSYDDTCAKDYPDTPYFASGLRWKPPQARDYLARIYFGVDDTVYGPFRLRVKARKSTGSAPFSGVRYFKWPGGGDPSYRAVRFRDRGKGVQVVWTNDGPGGCFVGTRVGSRYKGRLSTFGSGSRRASYSIYQLIGGTQFSPPGWVKTVAQKGWSQSQCR